MIVENTIIQYFLKEGFMLERVLWISKDQTQVVMISIDNKHCIPFPYFRDFQSLISLVDSEMVRIVTYEPDLRLLSPDDDYLSKYEIVRDEKWELIKDMVSKEPEIYLPEYRGKMIVAVMQRTGKQKKFIYECLKRYWYYGKTKNGLLRNYFESGSGEKQKSANSGPKSKDRNQYITSEKDFEIFRKSVKKFHINEEKNLQETYSHMLSEHYNEGYYRRHGVMVPIVEPNNCPTLRQFKYWYYQNFNKKKKYAARHGLRKAEMNARAHTGTPEQYLQGPGELYEIDSTQGDVFLMSIDHQTEIGQAHVYFVKDVMSRFIAGMHVCKNPSWEEEMVALENAATDKVEFCAKYGVFIDADEWPSHHLPRYLIGDRAETKSKNSNNLVNLNIKVGNPPSYRGDLKPYVEQQHRHFHLRITQLVKGAVKKEHRNRGDKDPAAEAVCSIEEFTKLVILYVIEYNRSALSDYYVVTKEMYEEKVPLTPISIWNWGLNKNLLHEMPRDLIRYNLLPIGKGQVTRSGVAFEKMSYLCDEGLEEGWFEDEQIEGKSAVEVRYDPRNCSSIFIKLKSGKLQPFYLHPRFKEYESLHFEDVKAIFRYKNAESKKQRQSNTRNELNAVAKEINKSATIKTKIAQIGKSKAAKHKNKRLVRKMEKRLISSRNAWTAIRKDYQSHDNKTAEIIPFVTPGQTNNSMESAQTSNLKATSMQAFLMAQSLERRKNRE